MEEPETINRQALEVKEKAQGLQHKSTLGMGNNLGGLHRNQDKMEEAEAMHWRSLESHEKALGLEHPSTLDIVNNLGNLYADQGKMEEAEAMYRRALEGYENVCGPEYTSTLGTINNLGLLYKDQGKMQEAEAMYRRALEGYENAWGPEHTSTLDTVNNLGVLYRNQGKMQEAEAMFLRALKDKEKAWGPEHTSTLNTVNNLANVYADQGKMQEAESMYRQALEGYEKACGPEHTSTLNTVNNLANLYADHGKMHEAEDMYLRALNVFEKSLGPEHPSTLNMVNNLGILYADQGKMQEAESMYVRALEGFEKAWGPEHTPTLDTVYNLGLLYKNQGKMQEAEAMYLRALEGFEKAWGPEHPSTLNTVNNLANLYADQGKMQEAEDKYLRALVGFEKVWGREHASTLNTVNNLGLLYKDQGKMQEAQAMYLRALEGFEKAWGPEHPSTLNTVNNLANLYADQGEMQEAEAMYLRALEGKEKAWGPEHTSTLDTVNNLANLYADQGKMQEAKDMYLRALNGFEKARGPEHTSTLNTVNNLGLLYKNQGKMQEAEAMYLRALEGYEEAWRPEHASTLNTVNNLGLLYMDQGKMEEAQAMYLRAGPPSTLDIVNNLGVNHRNQGKKAKVKAMYQRLLNRFSSATTRWRARAADHIEKTINRDIRVDIEHDYPIDMIQRSSGAENREILIAQSFKQMTETRGNRSPVEMRTEIGENRGPLEDFAEATKEGNAAKVELLLKTTGIGRNVDLLERTLEEVARQGNEKIVESLLKLTNIGDNLNLLPRIFLEAARERKEKIVELLLRFTRIGQDPLFIGPTFLEAARKGHAKIVELFLKLTNIGREKASVLKSVMPPITPQIRESSELCIHEARSIARRHKATLAILDTWQLGFEKKRYMSLDALLTDERLGIIPDWFECDWEVQEVLQMNPCSKDHEFAIAKVLRSLVVLTGGRSSFEATVCEKYLTDKWGFIGLDLIDSVASVLDSADSERKCTGTSVFIDCLSIQSSRISVLCKADILPKEKRALLEALVWLCEAIRVPKPSSSLGMSTSSCQVECSSLEFSTLHARDQAESADAYALSKSLKLCFKLQALSHSLTLKENCWLPLFESGVIVKQSRPEIPESEKEDCFHGLEVSFDLMVQLAGVEIPVLIDGGVILVGYQTALVPTRMAGTSIQWHLETASESRLNPFELRSTRSNWVKETDWKAFKDLQCFIGWCRSAHINLGTSILTDQVRWSNEKSRRRTLRWSGISVGAQAVTSSPLQMGLVGQMTFTFIHNKIRFVPSTVFAKMLKDTSREVAIVVDCSDQRAWLVPKLSLLLHMSHVWIRRHEIDPNPIPYADAHHVGSSVEQTLRDCGDIALSGQGEDCLRLRQLLLGLNINLIESRQHTEDATRKKLFGFEFMDVVCEPPHGGLMKRALTMTGGRSWYGLSGLADAVVLCAGLGDAITAGRGENGEYTKCNTLPADSYYLAASLSCLNELIIRQGNVLACAQNGKITISKDHYWKISGNPFKDCTHNDNSSENCWYKTEIFQQVDQRSFPFLNSLKENGQSRSSPNIPLQGAVVFGKSSNRG